MKRLILFAVLFFTLAEPVRAGVNEGITAYKDGDYAAALDEWRPLAEEGDAYAQRNLAAMFQNGTGVRRNNVLAYALFDLATAKVADAAKYRDALARSMTPTQVKKAAKLARDARRGDAAAILGQAFNAALGNQPPPAKKRRASRQRDARAQNTLGNKYYSGRGVPKDYAKAAKWFRKAAQQGLAQAQRSLGYMYREGLGVSQDYAEAAKWYRKAAEQGNAYAQRNLGDMYSSGRGVPQDHAEAAKWYNKAAKWFKKAAEQGNARAQVHLGALYHRGLGVPRDYAEAAKWYRKAAEQGNASAQRKLGAMYDKGLGVPQDDTEAAKWRHKAAEQPPPAKKPRASRKPCEKSISPADIVGKWQSSPTLGQLGFMRITVQFNEDRTFTQKYDFLSFPTYKPDLEYFWHVINGTYSVTKCEFALNIDKTMFVQKMRGEDETRGPNEGKQRPQVFRWEEGKLVTKDLVLTRIEPK